MSLENKEIPMNVLRSIIVPLKIINEFLSKELDELINSLTVKNYDLGEIENKIAELKIKYIPEDDKLAQYTRNRIDVLLKEAKDTLSDWENDKDTLSVCENDNDDRDL